MAGRPPSKLEHDKLVLLLRMHAEGHGMDAIRREFRSNHNVRLEKETIYKMLESKTNQSMIQGFREKYLADVRAVPIANKRPRIEDYQKNLDLINEMIAKIKVKGLDKITKSDRAEICNLIGKSVQVKTAVRDEMEAKPNTFQNVNILQEVTDESLHKRREELLGKLRKSESRPDDGGTSGVGPDPEDISTET